MSLQVLWLLAQAGERFPQGHSGNPSWNLPERGLSDWRMDEHYSGLPAEWSILQINKFLIETLTKKEGGAIDVSWPWIRFYPDIPIRIPGVPLWTLREHCHQRWQELTFEVWHLLVHVAFVTPLSWSVTNEGPSVFPEMWVMTLGKSGIWPEVKTNIH